MSSRVEVSMSAYRAVLKALKLARFLVQDIAADERAERRQGAGRRAETAIDRAEKLLKVRQ